MNMEKWKAVFSDEAFVKSLFELETVTEVQAALQEKELVLTEEEILAIRDMLTKLESGEISEEQLEQWKEQAEDGEVSEEVLEQVSGGLVIGTLIVLVASCVGAAVGGAAAGVKLYHYMNDRRGW